MSLFTRVFVKDAAERAIKTFAQSALATLGLGAVDVLSTNWGDILSVGAGAALISVLTSVVSAPRDDTLSPASAVKVPAGTEPFVMGRHALPEDGA